MSGSGLEAHPDVHRWSGCPPGWPGVVRGTLPDIREWSGAISDVRVWSGGLPDVREWS